MVEENSTFAFKIYQLNDYLDCCNLFARNKTYLLTFISTIWMRIKQTVLFSCVLTDNVQPMAMLKARITRPGMFVPGKYANIWSNPLLLNDVPQRELSACFEDSATILLAKMYRGVIQFLFLCSTYELPCMNKEGTLYTCCECFKINSQQTPAAVGIAFCTQTGQGERLSGMIARAVSSGY